MNCRMFAPARIGLADLVNGRIVTLATETGRVGVSFTGLARFIVVYKFDYCRNEAGSG